MKTENRNRLLLPAAMLTAAMLIMALLSCNGKSSTTDMTDPYEATGTINGHEYVDLGLSVKWATCNVGAYKPEDYGDYYAWGEAYTKSSYYIDNIKGTARDVAHVEWGGTWRMPTKAEIEELIDNCDYEWTTLNGVEGGRFTSRKNGKSIFLPVAGGRAGTSLDDAGSKGTYWSSTPLEGSTLGAYCLFFGSDFLDWDWCSRAIGQSVRPVSE